MKNNAFSFLLICLYSVAIAQVQTPEFHLPQSFYDQYNSYLSDEYALIQFADGFGIDDLSIQEASYIPGIDAWWVMGTSNEIDAMKSDPAVSQVYDILQGIPGHPIGVLDEFTVRLKEGTPKSWLYSIAAANSLRVLGEDALNPEWIRLSVNHASPGNAFEMAYWLKKQPEVIFAEPNLMYVLDACSTNDPFLHRQWNLQNDGTPIQGGGDPGADISAFDAWSITTGSPDIKIAVLDSGTDTAQVDLAANMLSGYDATGGGTKGYPDTDYSQEGHGTACSGIIAAIGNNDTGVAGVAYNCKIIPVRVFDYVQVPGMGIQPISTTFWMSDGLNWAWQHGADVMSNSWAIPDELLQTFFNLGDSSSVSQAIANGTIYGRDGLGTPALFSSGNDGNLPLWPSNLEFSIAVNATSMCDERKMPTSCDGESWWEGNWGSFVNVGAPGVKVTTTDFSGNEGYSPGDFTFDFNGTSAACPNAAGVMALILSVNPNLPIQDAKYILEYTADTVGGYDYSEIRYSGPWSQELGYGRVNAYDAVVMAQTYVPTGMEDIRYEPTDEVMIYPNPFTDIVYVEHDFMGDIRYEILDISGLMIFTGILPEGTKQIDMQAMEFGMYLLRLQLEDTVVVKPILSSEF